MTPETQNVDRLIQMYMHVAEMNVIIAEIEAMKAANTQRILYGEELAHPASAFSTSAERLLLIENCLAHL